MPRGRPTVAVRLNAKEGEQLRSLAPSRSLPRGMVQCAQIVLACAEGQTNTAIAEGIAGLHDEQRPGRPPVSYRVVPGSRAVAETDSNCCSAQRSP